MNKKEIIDGVKRKGSYGVIISPELNKKDREEIERKTKEFIAGGGKIQVCENDDEYAATKKASFNY